MPSRYLNFRCSVPWLILFLETLFLIHLFFRFTDVRRIYSPFISYPGKPGTLLGKEGQSLLLLCPAVGVGLSGVWW